MKFYYLSSQIIKFKRRILDSLSKRLGKDAVLEAFDGFTIRERIYHTWPLFQMFLNQVALGTSLRESIASGSYFSRDPKRGYELLMDRLIADRLPHRPGRIEPRKIKHRGKNYSYLTEPRNLARDAVFIP